jgi:hypothetical protein
MLDGKRYFENFPDEAPVTRRIGLHSAELLKTLAELEKEFRAFLEQQAAQKQEKAAEDQAGS